MNRTIAVIGTLFLDCKGFAPANYDPAGRNIGTVHFQAGGVGRNVAENLHSLGAKNFLISTIDKGGPGEELCNQFLELGMTHEYLQPVAEGGMGIWLAILGKNGELFGSVSNLPNLKLLEAHWLNISGSVMNRVGHVALEMDLTLEITRSVLQQAKQKNCKVYGLPGNLSIIQEDPSVLSQLDLFICNEVEGAKLFGMPESWGSLEDLLPWIEQTCQKEKLQSLVITLGEQGAIWWDGKKAGAKGAFKVVPVDSSGAGDSFFAGVVAALVAGTALSEAVEVGTWVAARTVEAAESIRPDLPTCVANDSMICSYIGK